jgi:hypothetical protein
MGYKLTDANYVYRDDNTLVPISEFNIDYAQYLIWLSEGNTPEPADLPSMEQLLKLNISAIQLEMDIQAKLKGYDNILSASTYAVQSQGTHFQAEGAAFVEWRTKVWAEAYAVLADVEAGLKPLPTASESVAAMPILVLP